MNALIRLLNKTGLLQSDVDYHLIRASMVLIFLLFGYQKWFEYEAQAADPLYQQRTAHFLALSRSLASAERAGSSVFQNGCSVRSCSSASGIRGWGILGRARVDLHVRGHGHHHSLHAEWVGPQLPGFQQWPETFLSS